MSQVLELISDQKDTGPNQNPLGYQPLTWEFCFLLLVNLINLSHILNVCQHQDYTFSTAGLEASEVIQMGGTSLSLFAERISRFQGPFTGLLPPMSYHCSLALDSHQASRPPTGTITILFRLNFFFLSQKRFLASSGRFYFYNFSQLYG